MSRRVALLIIISVAAVTAAPGLYLFLKSHQPQPQSQGTEVTCEAHAFGISSDENKGMIARCDPLGPGDVSTAQVRPDAAQQNSQDVVICEVTGVEVTNPAEYTGSVDPDACSAPTDY